MRFFSWQAVISQGASLVALLCFAPMGLLAQEGGATSPRVIAAPQVSFQFDTVAIAAVNPRIKLIPLCQNYKHYVHDIPSSQTQDHYLKEIPSVFPNSPEGLLVNEEKAANVMFKSP
jgi:hypothetical protein